MNTPLLPEPRERVRRLLTIFGGSPHSWREEWSPEEQRLIKTAIVIVPGGCYWARKTKFNGEYRGCTYCNFEPVIDEVTEGMRFRPLDYAEMVRQGLAEVGKNADKVCIFTGGSFAPRDIAIEGLLGMIDLVREHPTARHLLVESRPELLSDELVREFALRLGSKRLEIAVGFETQDDAVRNGRPGLGLNKGIVKKQLEAFVRMLLEAKVIPSAYVMLKPFERMSEEGAIVECLATISYCFEIGMEKVLLQATMPQESAKELTQAWKRGEWKPPAYSSIVRVIREMAHRGPIMLGHFDDIPPPFERPQGCSICTEKMSALFEEYRRSLNPKIFFAAPECACKRAWKCQSDTVPVAGGDTPFAPKKNAG